MIRRLTEHLSTTPATLAGDCAGAVALLVMLYAALHLPSVM
ncbi:MAG: hypothetical protein AAF871_15110 [Pseudomonadota bacterium]